MAISVSAQPPSMDFLGQHFYTIFGLLSDVCVGLLLLDDSVAQFIYCRQRYQWMERIFVIICLREKNMLVMIICRVHSLDLWYDDKYEGSYDTITGRLRIWERHFTGLDGNLRE